MVFDPDSFCSFCGMPGAKHEGGGQFNGVDISGHFCNRKCYDAWLKWKATLLSSKIKPVVFPQPGQTEGQAVLPI